MKALFFITRENLKKKKGDVLVLFFLIALATLLFYTSISVFFSMGKILDEAYDAAHTADLFYMSNGPEKEIREIMTAQEEVTEYEASDCLYFLEAEYRKEGEKEDNQTQVFFGRIEEERNIGKINGIEDMEITYDSVLLPYYMKAAEGFSVGDSCIFTLDGKEYKFQVAGFVEDPLFATPLNINVYGAYMSSSRMEDLLAENPEMEQAKYVQHKVRLQKGEDSFAFDQKLFPILTQEIPELSQTVNIGVNWKTMKGGVSIMSQISMGIVLAFSVLLMLVVLIIMRFSIRNYIEMNLKNIGILQAAGYTSKQLNITVMLEMAFIAGFAVTAGVLFGVAGSGFIGMFQGIMLGIRWKQIIHPGAVGLTILVILGAVFGVSLLCGRIYKKISVLESLRGGIRIHNFKKNHFALEKTRLPVPFALAGKNIMFEKAKNVSVFCIVMLLSFSTCVGFGLYENFALRTDNLMKMVGAEAGDILISGENLEDIGQEMEEWQEVERVLYSNAVTVKLVGKEGETAVTCDIWKQPELIKNEMLLQGRLPKYDNEIVLTSNIAKLLKADTGDTIYVTGQKEKMDYIVCGIDQKINNMGLKAMMTQEGAKRLNGDSQTAFLYVYTRDEISYKEISEKVLNRYPNVEVMDSSKVVESTLNGVVTAMVAICLIFVIITVFVVMMVEVLLIKSKVIRERKNLGLNKAFGFTTKQLISQVMLMNLPIITFGSVCGAFLSIFLMEPLIVVCLSFCGIKKCPFTIDFYWIIITVVGIILIALAASFLAAVRIRKIEPVKMLVEE